MATVSGKSISVIFPRLFAHFMSLSHFGNSQNILNFLIITKFVTVICDL